ncbi:MAG TPA: hypothetical protein VII47_15890 [Actinomycetota bacterium]|jgi:hypothetical protein
MGPNVSNADDSGKETDVTAPRGTPVIQRCPHDMDLRYCASCREHAPSADVLAALDQADPAVPSGERTRDAEGRRDASLPDREARV